VDDEKVKGKAIHEEPGQCGEMGSIDFPIENYGGDRGQEKKGRAIQWHWKQLTTLLGLGKGKNKPKGGSKEKGDVGSGSESVGWESVFDEKRGMEGHRKKGL